MGGTREDLRLLMVEDSEDDAELVGVELRGAGFDPLWERVQDEETFLDALRRERWDLIVSDYHTQRLDGLRAFALVMDLGRDIPFIFVSGALGEERVVEAMRAGAHDYFLKGNLRRLGAAVRRELDAARERARRRLAESAKLDERRRLELAVDASGAGVFEYRLPLGEDVYVGPQWARILGFTPEELPPSAEIVPWFFERIHPDDRPLIQKSYADFVAGRATDYKSEARVLRKDSSWVDVAELARAAHRDQEGRATHVVGVMLDLSEQKRLEAELRQAQKMEAVGRLAGGVAHDLNNILTAIFSFGHSVLEGLAGTDPLRADVQEVLGAAKKAERITAQLLAFSRARPMSVRVVDVNEILEDLERMLERLLGEDIDLVTMIASDLWSVRVDPTAIDQVIVNLAINARDAMPEGGRLTLETVNLTVDEDDLSTGVAVRPGDYVVIRVSDTGTGMDEATRVRIFEPFFTTKEPGHGTGLGLSTCYGIVKQAGGYISVHTEVGKGTTFEIHLPRADVAAMPLTRTPPPQSRGGTETILVVEDDEQVRRIVVRVLERQGYRVLQAPHGEAALAAYGDGAAPIDLLMTDVVMPGMNGRRLAEQLADRLPSLRVLYTSGYAASAVAHRGLIEEDANVLAKPFTPPVLLATVRSVLDASGHPT